MNRFLSEPHLLLVEYLVNIHPERKKKKTKVVLFFVPCRPRFLLKLKKWRRPSQNMTLFLSSLSPRCFWHFIPSPPTADHPLFRDCFINFHFCCFKNVRECAAFTLRHHQQTYTSVYTAVSTSTELYLHWWISVVSLLLVHTFNPFLS